LFKRRPFVIALIAIICSFIILPQQTIFADISDGTYEIDYEMKERSSDNTSIADGYFTKPAYLMVEDGTQYIQLTVTGTDMIKSLGVPSGSVYIINEDDENDEKIVRFIVEEDLSEPLMMDMHVVVPDLYDTEHQARAVFDVDSIEEVDPDDIENWPSDLESFATYDGTQDKDDEEKANDSLTGEEHEDENVTTNDSSSALWTVIIIVGLIIVIIAIWLARRR